jgi:wyosine [tRNA(Phe)-imidazoG37] synthetase (radical SAM superfamily)
MTTQSTAAFTSVYGPVDSWRYGRSLGIDPIGLQSTCSFNCVYCQLGEIQVRTSQRQVFVPTEKIVQDLQAFAPWDVDVVTLSGNGEPTLALNLAEIIAQVKEMTHKPVLVLTNGTLLGDSDVQAALALADKVSVKLDAVNPDQLQRVNRPVMEVDWLKIWTGIQEFRQRYPGHIGLQTMLLTPPNQPSQDTYIQLVRSLHPDEIQLNTPTRPKPLTHQLDGRGNHTPTESRPYPVQQLKQVSGDVLQAFAAKIQDATNIPVRCAPR